MGSIIDRHQLQSLDPSDVTAYLRSKGWHEESSGYERATLWTLETDTGKLEEILVPNDTSLRDFAIRMAEAFWTLEQVEQRPNLDVLRDIIYASSDVIRLRRLTEADTPGAIPLIDGVTIVEEALALITAAACSAVLPRKVVPSRRPVEVQDYLRRVKLGQTEQGSFVLTIVSNVAPLLTPGAPNLLELMDDPFPRRVTKTLTAALGAVKEGITAVRESSGLEVFVKSVEQGVSADLCEAIVRLIEATGPSAYIGFEVTWDSK